MILAGTNNKSIQKPYILTVWSTVSITYCTTQILHHIHILSFCEGKKKGEKQQQNSGQGTVILLKMSEESFEHRLNRYHCFPTYEIQEKALAMGWGCLDWGT